VFNLKNRCLKIKLPETLSVIDVEEGIKLLKSGKYIVIFIPVKELE